MSATYIHTKRKPGFAKLILRFLAILYFVALAASIVYLWSFTQDRFVSIASFKVSKQGGSGMETGLLQLALPGLSDSGSLDSQITIGYFDSADFLLSLEKEFNLVEHYSSPAKDYFFRLEPDANLEDRLKYYRSRISAHYNKETTMTEIHVDTFDPELSRNIAAAVLRKSEDFINVINQRIADQQLGFVRSELDRANQQVMDANNELLALQNQHNFIRPDEIISANLKAVEAMKMEQLQAQIELSSMLRDSPGSPRIETTQSRLRSLGDMIETEAAKLSGTEKDRLNQLLVRFRELEFRIEFASKLRMGAEAMLERNRVEAAARSRFFTVIQHPYLPEDVAIPRRPYATATILALGGLLFLIFRAFATSLFERS